MEEENEMSLKKEGVVGQCLYRGGELKR